MIYKGQDSYLASVIKMLMNGEDVSNADMPKPVDYFPSNYWFNCKVEFCRFESMDLIMNLDLSGKELDLVAIRGLYYHRLSFGKNSTADGQGGQLRLLSVDAGGDLKDLLTGLIKFENKNKPTMRLYEEFVHLKFVETGHYFALNETSDLFFLIKERTVYSLFTVRQANAVKQQLHSSKIGEMDLFGNMVGNSYIQAAFTRPNQRLVLIMDDFLLHYSFESFTQNGNLAEVQESFEIPNTFEHVCAAITLHNYTYIFTRRHYQVYHVQNFNSKKFQKTAGNFLDCPPWGTYLEPSLVSYSDSIRRPTTQRHLITSSPLPNKVTTGTIIKIVLVITVGAFVAFLTTALYVKKFQKTTFIANVSLREKEKKSFSGSSGYLSTAFNLAKSSSEKDSKKTAKLKEEAEQTKGDKPKSKGPKKFTLKSRMGSRVQPKVDVEDQAGAAKEGSPRNLKIDSRQGPSTQSAPKSVSMVSKQKSQKRVFSSVAEPSTVSKTNSKMQSKTNSKMHSKTDSKMQSKTISKPN